MNISNPIKEDCNQISVKKMMELPLNFLITS